MTKPFIKPSVFHPHIVHESGKENPQHMYEVANGAFSADDIFAAIGKDPLRGIGDVPATQQSGSTGIIGFIKDNPLLSALAAIGIGAAGYAFFSGGRRANPELNREVQLDDDGNVIDDDVIDGEVIPGSIRTRVRNPRNAPVKVQLALPAPQFAQQQYHYITNPGLEPIVIRSKEQPPVTITMPAEKGLEVSAPGMIGTGAVVKKRRRRKKPERVQVRDQAGKFTSSTVSRRIPAGYAQGGHSQKKEQVR